MHQSFPSTLADLHGACAPPTSPELRSREPLDSTRLLDVLIISTRLLGLGVEALAFFISLQDRRLISRPSSEQSSLLLFVFSRRQVGTGRYCFCLPQTCHPRQGTKKIDIVRCSHLRAPRPEARVGRRRWVVWTATSKKFTVEASSKFDSLTRHVMLRFSLQRFHRVRRVAGI